MAPRVLPPFSSTRNGNGTGRELSTSTRKSPPAPDMSDPTQPPPAPAPPPRRRNSVLAKRPHPASAASAAAPATPPLPATTPTPPATPTTLAAQAATTAGGGAKKARKPYTISRQREVWTAAEHALFLDALAKHGRSWKLIEGHVRTKNVIQIRSHAQKYFIKLQKCNAQEAVPPPRPKRRNSAPPSAPAGELRRSARPVGGAGRSAPPPQQQPAVPFVPPPPQLLAGLAALTPVQRQQLAFGSGAHTAAQQQQFAAALQQHMQLFQFPPPPPTIAAPFYPRAGHHQRTRSSGNGRPRPSAAKAISPRLPALPPYAPLPPPPPLSPAPYAFGAVGVAPQAQAQQGAVFLQQHALQYQQRQMHQIHHMRNALENVVSDRSLAGTGSACGTPTTTGSASLPPQPPQPSEPQRASSLPAMNTVAGEAAGSGGDGSGGVEGTETAATTSPNFSRIYGFFAMLFNPLENRKVDDVVGSLGSSTLDSEIVKLLVRNLEMNLLSDDFQEQLGQTYRDQQITQQQQGLLQVTMKGQNDDNELVWMSGNADGDG